MSIDFKEQNLTDSLKDFAITIGKQIKEHRTDHSQYHIH